ncbi:MAG TPA: hypothetical protein VHF06_34130 [Pseudonocardiaceae bacterium]|nr:hypothetical protein [Pseudonocardiaceae bacterium]
MFASILDDFYAEFVRKTLGSRCPPNHGIESWRVVPIAEPQVFDLQYSQCVRARGDALADPPSNGLGDQLVDNGERDAGADDGGTTPGRQARQQAQRSEQGGGSWPGRNPMHGLHRGYPWPSGQHIHRPSSMMDAGVENASRWMA